MKNWIIAALVAVIAAGGALSALAATQSVNQTFEIRVWEDVNDPTANYISARPEGGSWRTLGTISIPLTDGVSSSGRFRYGDIKLDVPVTVEIPDQPPVQDDTATTLQPEQTGDYEPVIASNVEDYTAEIIYHARKEAPTDNVRTDVRMRGPKSHLTMDVACFGTGGMAFGFLLGSVSSASIEEGEELTIEWQLDDLPSQEMTLAVSFLGDTPTLYSYEGLGFNSDWPNVLEGGSLVVRVVYRAVYEETFDLDAFAQTPVHQNLVNCGTY